MHIIHGDRTVLKYTLLERVCLSFRDFELSRARDAFLLRELFIFRESVTHDHAVLLVFSHARAQVVFYYPAICF